MNFFDTLKKLYTSEEFVKVRRNIRAPALMTAAIAGSVTLIALIVLLITGKLNDIIVSLNIRYNSLIFRFLGAVFLLVQGGALGYGIFLSLSKYHRYSKGRSGITVKTYPNGNSYKALHSALNK